MALSYHPGDKLSRISTQGPCIGRPRNDRVLKPPPSTLTVIVPLAPGEEGWRILLPQLVDLNPRDEILIVSASEQGVSIPATYATHSRSHILLRQIASHPGRARQLNAGARAAHGQWLWFLHADSRLTDGVLPALKRFVEAQIDALAYFDLGFDSDGPSLTWLNARGANLRARLLHLPFGDQGFVIRADTFWRIGGYDENLTLGEDHLLVRRARLKRVPLHHLSAKLITSARKYRRRGWWRTTVSHAWLTVVQARTFRKFLS